MTNTLTISRELTMNTKIESDEIHQMAFEEGQPAENGDGYNFTAEEFDLFVERLLTAAAAPAVERQSCKTCNDTRMVDDGELTCSAGGIPYKCGPIKVVKDCPDCASPPAPVAVDERAEFENYYRDRIMGNRTGVRFLRSDSGSYLDREVREMCSGWQARACLDKVKEMNR